MEEPTVAGQISQGISQLAQVRAALEEVTEVFGRKDAAGRTPIVVVPKRANRIRWGLVTLGILVILGGSSGPAQPTVRHWQLSARSWVFC